MEKRTRTYDLDALKMAFVNVKQLRITASGLQDARAMGFSRQDIIDAIQSLQRSDFVKSMTTYYDHRVWQDVYNTSFKGHLVYIKFQVDKFGHFVISFKEK